jgi:hypothetical protein
MKKFPFFIPEDDLNLRLGRLLLLIEKMSFNRNEKLMLDLEKIVILEFLIKYPKLLNIALKHIKKETIRLDENEIKSIEALFPNRTLLFDFKQTKKLLQILISMRLIDAKIGDDSKVYYYINLKGTKCISELNSIYFERLVLLINKAKKIQSQSFSKLNIQIQNHIQYGFRD